MIVTILDLIFSLVTALAVWGALVLGAVALVCSLTAGGCWYGMRRYRAWRAVTRKD